MQNISRSKKIMKNANAPRANTKRERIMQQMRYELKSKHRIMWNLRRKKKYYGKHDL